MTVSGNGSYTTPTGFTLPTTGTVTGAYTWTASYSGDAGNHGPADQGGTAEQVTVSAASPSITTTPGGTVTVGSASKLTDSATISGGYRPTGSITFYLFAPGVTPNATDSNNVYTDTVTVSGNGTYTTASGPNPGGYLPTAPGTYQWVASYSGDGNDSPAASTFGNEPESVSKTSPSIATTPSPDQPIVGATLKDSATLSGGSNPTGTITFSLMTGPCTGGTVVDTEKVTVSGNGTYSTPTGHAHATAGSYQWVASYSGDGGNNNAVASTCGSEQVTVRYKVVLLYKAPNAGKVGGSAVPIKIELVNASGKNLSSSSLTVHALCVIPVNAVTQTCASALPGFTYTNQLFTFMSGLDTVGGYQFNVKTTDLPAATYKLLFWVTGEDTNSYHADANATFTLTK